jgi:hypothetical protein
VTREELRERLWPNDSFGDFDQGLNTAINKLREALADSAANPQFIETLPKRGYRFTHPVEAEPIQSVVQDTPAKRLPLGKPYYLFAIVAILVIVGGLSDGPVRRRASNNFHYADSRSNIQFRAVVSIIGFWPFPPMAAIS